jgi:cysteinyl-tRNA synthetase
MILYNTLTRKKEVLKPLKGNTVRMYTCGPTVYNFAHIGNLRTYIFEDILKRALLYEGFKVRHAMNITDVGHLTSDADEGEDKLELGARREGLSPLTIARRYEKAFLKDTKELSILPPSIIARATDTIKQQISLIKVLEKKGYVYKTTQALYFDTSKFKEYGKLSKQKQKEKITGARADVNIDPNKKNPQDFVLWFFLVGPYKNHILRWKSPWGEGFPGWHLECSAIAKKTLGQPFDIHCGGIDHIGTHHENEIAQSEAAFSVPLARIWAHGAFLSIDGGKMSKSKNNFYTLAIIKEKGFSPLDFRYLCLGAQYRAPLSFTWEALESARNARMELLKFMSLTTIQKKKPTTSPLLNKKIESYKKAFASALSNDLHTSQALAIVWSIVKDQTIPLSERRSLLKTFDSVLALGLKSSLIQKIPRSVRILLRERELYRGNKQFMQADALRNTINQLGYEIEDTAGGAVLYKK